MGPPPNAAEEITAITRRGQSCEFSRPNGESLPNVAVWSNPAKGGLVRQLPRSNIAPFIFHGQSDPQDPSESDLVLGSAPDLNARCRSTDELATLSTKLLRGPRNAPSSPPKADNIDGKPSVAHLTVDDIACLVPSNACFSYLSPCPTAKDSALYLQD
jgi:hypothetical protein